MRPNYNVFKKTTQVALLFGISVLGACSHDDLSEADIPKTDDFVSTNPHHVTTDNAIAYLRGFMGDGAAETRTADAQISGIDVLRWGDVSAEGTTRSATPAMPSDEPLAYIMNFEGGGYAIVGADERQGGVVALVEQGSMSAATLAAAKHEADNSKDGDISLPTYINSNVVACLEELASQPVEVNPETRIVAPPITPGWDFGVPGGEVLEYQAPMLKTKWTQWAPYNKHCSITQHRPVPVGCGAQALVQVFAYNKKQYNVGPDKICDVTEGTPSTRIYYRGQDLDLIPLWSDITAAIETPEPQTQSQWDAISRFLDAAGWAIRMNYGSEESTISANDAALLMRKETGYTNVQVIKTPKVNDVKTMICNGLPLVVSGSKIVDPNVGYTPGTNHMWVVDGWRYVKFKPVSSWLPPTYSRYVRSVFGFGGQYDGWYMISANTDGSNTLNLKDAEYSTIRTIISYTIPK